MQFLRSIYFTNTRRCT